MSQEKNQLWPEDIALFDSMVGHYQSDNEREFFEKQRYKEEYVVTISNDLVLHEDNNEDKIYIVRCWFCEYVVGGEGYLKGEEHYMNLSETLNANLKKTEFLIGTLPFSNGYVNVTTRVLSMIIILMICNVWEITCIYS
jgi:hypothetical protein